MRADRLFSLIRTVDNKLDHASTNVKAFTRLNELGIFEISDSFNDSTYITDEQAQSKLFMGSGGYLTLPRLDTTKLEVLNVRILDSSNGSIQYGHGLDAIKDGNIETWFEYSRGGLSAEDDTQLNLDMIFNLKGTRVVNFIKITPINLDDKSFPIIADISTSVDGREYKSIKSSLPSDIEPEEEEILFTLGPVGSRNKPEVEFVFTPRTAKYVKISITQGKKSEAEDGTYIQKIGVRDVELSQIRYKGAGELVTSAFKLPFIPTKVLLTERTASTKPLTRTEYRVSVDGDGQYFNIEPDDVLEINTGSNNSVNVTRQINEIKLKINAVRDDSKFNGVAAPLAENIVTINTIVDVDNIPLTFRLQNIPIH
jgi:hypothetical protein